MNIMTYEEHRALSMKSARLTTIKDYLEDIGRLKKEVPQKPVEVAQVFLAQNDLEMSRYSELFFKNMGKFYAHYLASVPFVAEELSRIGLTMCRFAQWLSQDKQDDVIKYYEPGGLDGTSPRTIAEYTNGLVRTITDNINLVNYEDFHRLLNHNFSKFHSGPHVDITPEYIASQPELRLFIGGFDIIHSSMTYQFFHPHRDTQYFYLKRLLKENGLIVIQEKLLLDDEEEYERREQIKDTQFKPLYFTAEEIQQKRATALVSPEGFRAGQVDFDTCVSALKGLFNFVYLIWNSTNFYEFVVSDSESVISEFLNLLPSAYVPAPFCAETNLPRRL
ncbi:MAG: hypothetical protein F6K26_23935 [Moorea sp. SIO2I5]|nr:hypothetical protein [Moorena sp. SIO2I5]